MPKKTVTETAAQLALRLRREERKLSRAVDPDEAEAALDEMVRRSIDEHGA